MKKRSKYIALSVSALALVSVCSIGFATWLVGIQQTTDEVTLKAQVDNYVNDTIFLSATLSTDSVKICETSKVDKTGNNIIGTTTKTGEGAIGYAEDGLQFKFADITLKVSKTTTAKVPDRIEVSLADNNAWNKVTTNTLGNEKRPDTGIGWTYLTLGENGSLKFSLATDFDKKSDDPDYDTYTLKSGKLTQTFGWGTFFGGKAPTTFYNNLYADAMENFEAVVAGVTAITTELKAMKDAFIDQTITLKVKAVTSSPVGA